jgi:hypothetical protein
MMSSHRILHLCLTRHITFILPNLAMRRMLSLETLKIYLDLRLLPLSHRHTTPVLIHMGSIEDIQMVSHLTP